jgi:DNA-directed RNA polymerase specialized sigma24 family protein
VGWEDSQFPEFFASQYEGLRRLGFLLTGDWSQGEELAQDALVRVYWRWTLVRRQHPEAYARRVLINRHRSLLRRLRLEVRHAGQARSGRWWSCATTRIFPSSRSPGCSRCRSAP